jgi:hypothetical protein
MNLPSKRPMALCFGLNESTVHSFLANRQAIAFALAAHVK